MDAHLENDL